MEDTMSKFAGGKFNGSHTTAIDGSENIIEGVAKMAEVTKITLGKIDMAGGHAPLRMKIADRPAGAKLTIRAGTFVQEIHIYFTESDRESVSSQLKKLAPERHQHKRGGTGKRKHEHVSARTWIQTPDWEHD